MNKFSYRLRFYSIGFIIGMIFLVVFLNQRSSCMNYLPNGRVLSEVLTKNIKVSSEVENYLKSNNKPLNWVRDTLFVEGKIDFDRSQPRKKPCGIYLITHQNKEFQFTKCKNEVNITKISKP